MTSYYSNYVLPKIDEFIRERLRESADGYQLEYDHLMDEDKRLLACILFEADNRHSDILLAGDYEELSSALIRVLKERTLDNLLEFGIIACQNVVQHYEQIMTDLIQERLAVIEQEDRDYLGIQLTHHCDNGEVTVKGGI